MEVGDAVFMGRAVRIPLDSPNYASFVRAMNEPATMPCGFYTASGLYVPTEAEDAFAVAAFAQLEQERGDARLQAEFEDHLAEQDLCDHLIHEPEDIAAMMARG
jgi:hypothetical protein